MSLRKEEWKKIGFLSPAGAAQRGALVPPLQGNGTYLSRRPFRAGNPATFIPTPAVLERAPMFVQNRVF